LFTALQQEFGFGQSFAVLLDAIIDRICPVRAVMPMLEMWNWYAPGMLRCVGRDN